MKPLTTPIDFSRLEHALANPLYWLELGLVLVCLAAAWYLDRRLAVHVRKERLSVRHASLTGSVSRVVFSLFGLLFLAIARPAFVMMGGTPFFISIAVPMLVALAIIRMLLYVMRRLFAQSTWLKTSERAIAYSIWFLVVLYFLGVLQQMAIELDDIVIPIGKGGITLLTIFKSVAAVVVTLVVSLWLSGLIEQRLATATRLDNNLRAVLGRLVRAVLLVVGVLIALESIGFDLTLLTVFGGALGVGVGLGLQKFAANYIAGFTILLDKSIRLGDMITADGRQGRVTKVTSRYVVLRSLDGIEALVPNETLITTTVLNHSAAPQNVRLASPMRIAHDADAALALRLMEEAARAEPRALDGNDAPAAFINAISEAGIDLELIVWLSGGAAGVQGVRSALHQRILLAFAREGIALPPPRRDVLPVPPVMSTGAVPPTTKPPAPPAV